MTLHRVAGRLPSIRSSVSQVIRDDEFGVVTCRRYARSRSIKIRVDEHSVVSATLPPRAPLYLVTQLLNEQREAIRKLLESRVDTLVNYNDRQIIGHAHHLRITHTDKCSSHITIRGQVIELELTPDDISPERIRELVRPYVKKALQKEARAYLPRQLAYLAEKYGFNYTKVRFAEQKGRWGSCSSSGTISLNVVLMSIQFELIDYVLIHELAHTKHLNHSPAFWQIIEDILPDYKERRRKVRTYTPSY